MKCGQCERRLQLVDLKLEGVSLSFRTSRGTHIKIHFCSLSCLFWGGVKYAKGQGGTTAPTTERTFRALYPGAVE